MQAMIGFVAGWDLGCGLAPLQYGTLTLLSGEENVAWISVRCCSHLSLAPIGEVICANDRIGVGSARWTVRGGHMARTGADWTRRKYFEWEELEGEHQIRLHRVQITEAMQRP